MLGLFARTKVNDIRNGKDVSPGNSLKIQDNCRFRSLK